jgi:hypothetical protein
MGRVVNDTSRPLYPPKRDPAPIAQEDVWAPEPHWTGADNLVLLGIRSPDRPSRNKSPVMPQYKSLTFLFLLFQVH